MTIVVRRPRNNVLEIRVSEPESIERLQAFLNKAANIWREVHPEIQELVDMVVDGKIQQDYWTGHETSAPRN